MVWVDVLSEGLKPKGENFLTKSLGVCLDLIRKLKGGLLRLLNHDFENIISDVEVPF